ncbi:hypothetical protein F6J84_04500 [Microbacterium caowuchunii]|uniref:hypothetical protein n=1 Tax=Microbacterium caowuchunii TaxID=2614638 RepID=UPI001246BD40|nr:hypothetical protein [Microbacterium caowuchunii]QEV99441.1 hypothetical protein F6J84_04500 [Microbacterium caowuchunii]
MNPQMPAALFGRTAAPDAAPPSDGLTPAGGGDRSTRYAGAVSLAAVLGGTLWAVARAQTPPPR